MCVCTCTLLNLRKALFKSVNIGIYQRKAVFLCIEFDYKYHYEVGKALSKLLPYDLTTSVLV